ncbi:hypothetical protein C8J46_11220 [Sphingomonas sp. PP-F2F-A104-K0414]|nr:hypothetical protein [Sphingomonas sp. PP-F2F-A104-K0414]TCP95648.1 hypothetical protein C8J46_11220 [Sphingomonas sp. PP-F2F-A104-K0414]
MTTQSTPNRWRKMKTLLAIVVAIIGAPIVIIALFASLSGGRR